MRENNLTSEIVLLDLTMYGYYYDAENILKPLFMKKTVLPTVEFFAC